MATRYYKKLIGENVYLSPFAEDDAALFTAWLSDMEVTRTLLLFGVNMSLQSEKEWIATATKGGDHHFTIVLNESDAAIGNCAILHPDHANRHGEVGIVIGEKERWGCGLGTEAMRLLVDYGFNALNLASIELSVLATNTRAIRSYEKVGFQYAGKLREKIYRGGEPVDLVYMDILARDFESPYLKRIIDEGQKSSS